MATPRRPKAPFVTFTLSGPFFTADPVKTYRANVLDLMDKMARTGEAEVKARLKQGRPAAAGAPYVRGRTSSLRGRRWQGFAVVSTTDPGLTGEEQRRVNAQLSGRRVSVVGRTFKPPSRLGRNIGTMRGAEARKAFAGVMRTWRALAREHNLFRGL